MAVLSDPDPVIRTITARVGRSIELNGADEFLHLADASETPLDIFDTPTTAQGRTFGMLVRFLKGNVDSRNVLMGKHVDADDLAGTPTNGWWLERTAANTLRAVVIDDTGGTRQVFEAESTENLAFTNERADNEELPWHHMIFVTVDGANEELKLWVSVTEDQGTELSTKLLATTAMGTYVAGTNAASFSIGAIYDGTPTNEDFLSAIDVGWAAVWDEVLPDDLIRHLGRFQFPPPEDRRLVSLWHFTERTLDDWNRVNSNDLSSTGVTDDNYRPGPERAPRPGSVTASGATSEKAGSASLVFPHFRPEPGAEGHFYAVGYSQAPPLRYRRTTQGAVDPPIFSIGTFSHASMYGRWASMFSRENPGPVDVWRLYDTALVEDGAGETPIAGWEPHSKISGDSDFRNPADSWDSDRLNDPMRIFGYAVGGTAGVTNKFLEISGAPDLPIKAGSLLLTASGGVTQVLYDARDNGFCYFFSTSDTSIYVIDVSTPGTPSLATQVTDTKLGQGLAARMVQVGTRLYVTWNQGVQVIDIATPATASYVAAVETDPGGANDDTTDDLVILQSKKHIMTTGADGFGSGDGVVHVWDIVTDPDSPALVKRVVTSALPTQPFRIFRRGTTTFVFDGPGATSRLVAFATFDETNPRVIASWKLLDFHDDFSGVGTFLELDRETLLFLKDGRQFGFFRLDDGYGRSSFRVDYEVPSTPIDNATAAWEIRKLHHDLSRWDMEDDAVGVLPTGFTKIGTGASTVEVSDDFGLSGQPPTSSTKPKSLEVLLQAPDTEAGVREVLTPATADLGQGVVHVAQVWYFPTDPAEGFAPSTDLEVEILEAGGASTFAKTFSPAETTAKSFRWHRFEVVFVQNEDDTTTLELRLRVKNHVAAPVYFDALRFGPASTYPIISGRQLDYQNEGQIEPDGVPQAYTANYQDFIHDLRSRDTLKDTSFAAAGGDVTIKAIVAAHTRAKDAFDVDNVSPELAAIDKLTFEDDEDPAEGVRRAAEVAGGEMWLRGRQIFAEPDGFQVAPVAINDVEPFLWEDLRIKKSIANLVTRGEIQGDASINDRPSSSYTETDTESRLGPFFGKFDPSEDVKTATVADNLRDKFRARLGKPQIDGSVVIRNEPRLRAGQIMPVQIENAGFDFLTQIADVSFKTDTAGQLIAAVTFSLLKESVVTAIIPQKTKRGNQRGKREQPQHVEADSAWQV